MKQCVRTFIAEAMEAERLITIAYISNMTRSGHSKKGRRSLVQPSAVSQLSFGLKNFRAQCISLDDFFLNSKQKSN